MKFFPFIILAVYFGANYYVFLRLWQMLPAGSWLRPVIIAFAIVAVLSVALFFAVGRSLPVWANSAMYGLGTSWMFILLYLFMVILVADLIPFTGLVDRTVLLRSNFYTFWGILGFVGIIMLAGNINYKNKRRIELTVETPRSRPGERMKMVVVSDLHLGYTIGKSEVGRWVELINGENPDLILIVGDLIDTDVKPLYYRNLDAVLRQLYSRYGVYMVPGNHEYISDINKSIEFIESSGITLLRDSTVTIDGRLVIAGRDDQTNPRRKQLADILEGADPSLPVVVADHQPSDLSQAVAAGAALQVSGHTHRGQVWPINWITDRIFEDSYGLVEKDGTTVYVSSGLGIWGGKFRIGSVSEYVVIHI